MQPFLLVFIYLSALLGLTKALSKDYCTLPGPLLPKPTGLATSSAVAGAGSKLSDLFDNIANGSLQAGFDPRNISFTIGMVSLSDPHPLWEYHHLAPANTDGIKTPDGDSEWMIGSVSKVFTELILLKLGLNVNDPIHKYLPQLKSNSSETDWNSITLASLANHLSGIRMNFGYPEIYEVVPAFEALGFPHLNPSDFPTCAIAGLNKACDPEQLIEALKNSSHPVVNPYDRPVYSSISFTLLSYALQAATGRNYTQLLRDEVLTPLNLTHTGNLPGNATNAVIPATQPNSWGVDYGDNAPGGGLHSSLNDLARLAHTILTRTALPNPAEVRTWLQPTGFAGSANTLVGAPWEIYRTPDLTEHNVDIHAKNGGALAYVARMALLDSYGVAFVAFTAGGKGNEALDPIFEAALATFVPAIEQAARHEAQQYVGAYSQDGGNVTGSLVLDMDDGPGLKVRKISRDGADMLAAIQTVWDLQPVSPGTLSTDFRLYPMEITREASRVWNGEEINVVEEDWRMTIAPGASRPGNGTSSLPKAGGGIWSSQCAAWQSVDTLYYGGEPIDRFVVVKDRKRNVVVGIESPALKLRLDKRD